jgi:hypothetical protein
VTTIGVFADLTHPATARPDCAKLHHALSAAPS